MILYFFDDALTPEKAYLFIKINYIHYCITSLLQLSIPKGKNPTHYATILKCTFPSHFKFYNQWRLQSMMPYNGYWPGGRQPGCDYLSSRDLSHSYSYCFHFSQFMRIIGTLFVELKMSFWMSSETFCWYFPVRSRKHQNQNLQNAYQRLKIKSQRQ